MGKNILKILKPGDYVIYLVIIFSLIIHYSLHTITPNQKKIVEITNYKNKIFRYSLNDNRMIDIPGPYGLTEIQIKNKSVRVYKASCPYKTCRHMSTISKEGEVIICIPNRIFIKIIGNQYKLDGVSK